MSIGTIAKISRGLRRDGKVVAFTHGAFDMFHYGHLYLLERTASKCDYLIVGIESDKNIQHYKSVKRPIVSEDERLDIIEGLKCVNVAFIQDEPAVDSSYHKLYSIIAPHFISIGRDFRSRERMERRASEMDFGLEMFYYGGNRSTTQIIDSVLAKYSGDDDNELIPGEELNLE